MVRRILVVASGQSNMKGIASGTSADRSTNPNVFVWAGSETGWHIADVDFPPFTPEGQPLRNNLAFHFCKRLQEDEGCEVYLNLSAMGSQPISEWEAPSGQQWIDLNTSTLAALASTEMAGKTSVDYFLWHQGEADPTNANYEAEFLALRDNAIASGWMTKHTPVIAGEIIAVTSKAKEGLLNLWADRTATWFNFAPCENIERYLTGPHFTDQGYVDFGRGPYYSAAKAIPRIPRPYARSWTPIILGSTGNPTVNYDASQTYGGSYRDGNVVDAWFKIKLNSISGGGGYASIGGLPYEINHSVPEYGAFSQTGIATEVSGIQLPYAAPIILRTGGNNGIMLSRPIDTGTTPILISKLLDNFTLVGSIRYFIN